MFSVFLRKNLINFIVIGALGFFSWLVYDKFKAYERQQQQLIETQQNLQQINREQQETIKQIVAQNEQTLLHVETVQQNMRTVGLLRNDLRRLRETLTADDDPSLYQNELNGIIQNQYACLEKVTAGETNARCE